MAPGLMADPEDLATKLIGVILVPATTVRAPVVILEFLSPLVVL